MPRRSRQSLEGRDAIGKDQGQGASDVRPNSRLGCQSAITRDVTVVCEISVESRKAFLDEHPELRGERR